MTSPLSLEGRVALVTGSSRGIGWETARLFAKHGATVVVNGRTDPDRVSARASQLATEFGVLALGLCFDVSDPERVRACYQQIHKTYRRLDILVNNAGVLRDALLGMISTELIEETLQTNAVAPIYNLQEASRLMARGGGGSIINMSSIIGVTGNEGQAVYAASKAAVIGLTRAAAKELAPKNIRVNAIAPGFIDTEMTRQLPRSKYDERVRSIKMNRIGQPEDVANAALFLASDLSSYVTGQVIGVDGGMVV